MNWSLKSMFVAILAAAVVLYAAVWIQSRPASATWSYSNTLDDGSGRGPQFHILVHGVDDDIPTVGYMIRHDDEDTSSDKLPRVSHRRINGLRSDLYRDDFVLFAGTNADDLTKLRLDRDVAKRWFGTERVNDYAQCVKFWDAFVEPNRRPP